MASRAPDLLTVLPTLALLVPMIFALAGCGDGQTAAEAAKPRAAQPGGSTGQCTAAGPLACRLAPVESLEGACAQLRECLSNAAPDAKGALQITSCDAPSAQTSLPAAAAPLEALAVITVDLDHGIAPSHAAYVFAKDARGWCPSVELLEPLWRHGGHCQTNVRLGTDGAGAAVRAERICRMPLDREERARGVSDVAEHECVETRYAVAGGSVKQLSRQRSDGACRPK
jgi:hypothetical protein